MRDLLLVRAVRRPRRTVTCVLTVVAGLSGQWAGASARAQSLEPPPAHAESAPVRAPPAKPLPAPRTTADSAITLPLTARVVTWPVLMALGALDGDRIPPILELSFGLKKRWFELSMGIGIATGRIYDSPGTYFGLSVAVGFYSLQRTHVRLRHGLTFAVLAEVGFERHPQQTGLTPLPMARLQFLDIQVRLGKGLWLEICPLTASFPGMYEVSVGFRYEIAEPAGPAAPAQRKSAPPAPAGADHRFHPFASLEMGLVWWQHFEPPVLGSTFGRVGFRHRWFETAIGFGSPAWATWRARGLYELFVDLGFYSLRRARLRLRHQVRLGVLFHNPPFEPHTWSGVVMHADFIILAFALGRGFWLECQPLTISIAPRDQLSSSVALRYEF